MRIFANRLLTKENPKQWSYAVQDDNLKTMTCTDLVFNGTQFVVLGNRATSDGKKVKACFSVSDDGKNWSIPVETVSGDYNTQYGQWSTFTYFKFSDDADSAIFAVYQSPKWEISYYKGVYHTILPTDFNAQYAEVKEDSFGTSWSSIKVTDIFFSKVTDYEQFIALCSNGEFLFCSDLQVGLRMGGKILPSKDVSDTWNKMYYDNINNKVIVIGNNKYAIMDYTGDFVPNNYTVYDLFDKNWNAIDCINGKYFVCSTTGEATTSTDLENWTEPVKLPYLAKGAWVATAHNSNVQVLLSKTGYISTKRI